MNDIWGKSKNEIYAVGNRGTILFYDGQSWKAQTTPTNQDLLSVWGCGGGDPAEYAVGANGTILKHQDGAWKMLDSGTKSHLFGVTCKQGKGKGPLDPQHIYVVGEDRTFLVSTGNGFKALDWSNTPHLDEMQKQHKGTLYAVASDGKDLVYAVGLEELYLQYDDDEFAIVIDDQSETPGDDKARFYLASFFSDVWVANPSQVFSLLIESGDTSVRYYDRDQVMAQSLPWMNGAAFYAIWGINSRDILVLAGSKGQVSYLDQTKSDEFQALTPVSQHPQSQDLFGVWGIEDGADNYFYLVGNKGTILELSGMTLKAKSSGSLENLHGIWGKGEAPEVAVGEKGVILTRQGGAWSLSSSTSSQALSEDLLGLWGQKTGTLWAVGKKGSLYLSHSGAWQKQETGTQENLNALWGEADQPQVIVGDHGTILSKSSSGWQLARSGVKQDLHGVWGASANSVFAVGDRQTILHFDGKT